MDNTRPGIIKVALILWLIACVIFYLKQGAQVTELQFSDSDDYMRLVQVSRWIDGADWHDLTQPRMNPPHGVEMHWTRLPDLPIAAVVVTLEDWIGRDRAMVVAAFVAPAMMLLSILLAAAWAARPIITRAAAPNAALVTLMALPLIVQFGPGRLDHHGWQLLFAMVSIGALLRILIYPGARGPAFLAACAGALGLWVGVEALTWLTAFCLTLLVSWIFFGRRVLGTAVTFSLALFGLCLATLPFVRTPEYWLIPTCDSFSIVYVVFTGAIFAFFGGLWLFARHTNTLGVRLTVTGLCAVGSATLMVVLFPGCLSHPYQQVDPELARLWMDNIKEARSILSLLSNRAAELPYWVASPILGLTVAFFRIKNTCGRARLIWTALAIHLILSLSLSLSQMRFIPLAHVYAVIPIAWLLGMLFRLVEENWIGMRRALLMAGSLLAVGPFPSLALLMMVGSPATEAAVERCNIRSVESTLTQYPDTRVIATFINPGAELLFRTPHSVLAAGYHRNADGNLDVYNLFSARGNQDALKIIQDRNVELILVCPAAPEMGFYKGRDYTTFVERLIDGETPSWLTPLSIVEDSSELLFEVSAPGAQN